LWQEGFMMVLFQARLRGEGDGVYDNVTRVKTCVKKWVRPLVTTRVTSS
jgi:hypothetical protein